VTLFRRRVPGPSVEIWAMPPPEESPALLPLMVVLRRVEEPLKGPVTSPPPGPSATLSLMVLPFTFSGALVPSTLPMLAIPPAPAPIALLLLTVLSVSVIVSPWDQMPPPPPSIAVLPLTVLFVSVTVPSKEKMPPPVPAASGLGEAVLPWTVVFAAATEPPRLPIPPPATAVLAATTLFVIVSEPLVTRPPPAPAEASEGSG